MFRLFNKMQPNEDIRPLRELIVLISESDKTKIG